MAEREVVRLRVASAALAEVDRLAGLGDWTRSDVLRQALRLGLPLVASQLARTPRIVPAGVVGANDLTSEPFEGES
jgi:hypothetical protein